MLRLDAALLGPAARQHGLASREQLRVIGLSDRQVDLRIAVGILRPVHPGVLHHRAVPFTVETGFLAASMAGGVTAVVSHRVLDLGAVCPPEVVAHAVEVAVLEKRVRLEALLAVIDRVGGRGRRGTAALRAALRSSDVDERLASVLERDLYRLVRRAGLSAPELQHELVCADGRVVRLDFAWPARRVVVEADGHRWHSTRWKLEAGLARRRSIIATGWAHYPYGWGDVHDRTEATVTELRSLSL